MTKKPLVSIVIPGYNCNSTINTVLDGLQGQTLTDFEVVLMNDYMKEKIKLKKKYGNVTIHQNPQNLGLAKTVNRGARLGKGKYMLMLHDDCVPARKDWLAKLVEPIEGKDVGCVISRYCIDYANMDFTNKVFSYIYGLGVDIRKKPKEGVEETKHLGGKADLFRKDFFLEIGGFDESFKTANEDTVLSQKILERGKKILVCNQAPIIHLFSETERQSNVTGHFKKALQLTRQGPLAFLKSGEKYKMEMAAYVGALALSAIHPLAPLLTVPLIFWERFLGVFAIASAAGWWMTGWPLPLIFFFYLPVKSAFKAAKYLVEQKDLGFVLVFVYSLIWDFLAGVNWLYYALLLVFQSIFVRKE